MAGGLWIPTDGFPDWLAALAAWTPAHGYGQLSWSVADGAAPGVGAVACAGGWFVVFGACTARAYRRAADAR